ncbi:hypothetical protein N0V93_002039 [Gnomoniopsis smithogilvyi]|uniref:Rhodopsin domain-containing protein n=1 Tax=Gnomoniopsis smithogilvyi TaxID=1191159 RepID=A0A9W9D1S8_9PEZI|nr:hypothetical protein N0V93_002039 [Gnomoniopsis smithogilvyi]
MARLAFRVFVSKADFGAEDWAILAAFLIGLPGTIVICVGTYPNGVGKDVWTLTFDQITNFLFFFYITEIQYFINLAALKLSLLLFYLRIFPDLRIRRLLAGTVAFDILFGAAFVGATLFQCVPMDYFWHMWDGEHQGHCFNINALGWANAGISIAMDFWMLALPLSQLKGLRLHWKKKAGVALMFIVGTFVTVVSILRLQALLAFATSTNFTWDNYNVHFWSTIEINIGIMCACMPAMRQILVWLFPVVFGGSTVRGTYGSGNKGRLYNIPRSKTSPEGLTTDSVVALNRPGTARMWDASSLAEPSLKQWSSRRELRWAVSMEDIKLKRLSSSVGPVDEELAYEDRRRSKDDVVITETHLGPG